VAFLSSTVKKGKLNFTGIFILFLSQTREGNDRSAKFKARDDILFFDHLPLASFGGVHSFSAAFLGHVFCMQHFEFKTRLFLDL
jgi:hypothetical protein